MSLQVWIPCDGNMKNQGLAGDFTLAGTPVYGAGIVTAKALSANVQQHYYNVPELVGVTEYSMCAWIKIDASAEYNEWADILRIQAKPGASSDVARIELRNASTPGKFAVYFSKDTAVGSNTNTYWNVGGDRNEANNKWCHIVMTKDATKGSLYINGEFIASQPCTAFEKTPAPLSGYISIGQSTSAKCPALVNDFRVYDHCLSPKEVEQIARGLVIHYPLALPSSENLIANGAPYSTSGWSMSSNWTSLTLVDCSVSPNGKAIRVSYTGGSTISSGSMHKQPIDYTKLKNGVTYTLSCYIRASQEMTIGFYNEWMSNPSNIKISTKWQRYTKTGTIDTSRTYHSDIFYIAQSVPSGVWIEAFGLKLEERNKATPWTPAPSEAQYAEMGYNSTIADDTSGFGHHGTVYGSPTYVTNTPRYPTGMNFNGSSQRVQTPFFAMPQDFSVSFWMKRNATTNSRQFMFTGWNGISCELHTDNTPFFRIANSGDSPHGSAITVNSGWVHYCGVYTRATSIELYINGKSVGKTSSTTVPSFTATSANLALYSTYYYNGQLSDFRLYATALSAEDVLELYNTAASLSENGVMFANELVEG